jgi:ubiquinol-cytochrome c reductase iron-sulfur subunit
LSAARQEVENVTKLKDALVAAVVLALGRGRRSVRRDPKHRLVPRGPKERGAESLLLALLCAATISSLAFVAVYALDRIGHQTQWLGLTLGVAFLLLAASCVVISRRLVVTEELDEPYPDPEPPSGEESIEGLIDQSGSRFTRGRLVKLAGTGAVGALGLAALAPALSLGPAFDNDALLRTPWKRGRRLVDERGRPLAASDIAEESFFTAYPEGADREQFGAPLVLVRLPLEQIRERRDWAPQGIVAYSKICTHAGCAVALYRKPTFADVEPKPALVCPCHYSTFDPGDAGKVLFGPAGRALPQLPLLVDRGGHLRAAGTFSGPVGPSWWGVRMRKAKS